MIPIPIKIIILIPSLCSAGQFIDKEPMGNTSYLDARYLNHSIGRFLTQDPMKQFNSHYIYGSGNVIMSSDPSGMMWEPEYPWGRKGLMGHYNSENPRASVEKAAARMVEHPAQRHKGVLSTAKEKVTKLVITPVASGISKAIRAITPDLSISAEMSIDTYYTKSGERYKGRNKDMGVYQDSDNMEHAKRLFSMRDTIERKTRYEMMVNNHYAGSEKAYENHVKINTSYDMDNYVRIRNKKHSGLATRSERAQLRKYHGDLLDNDGAVKDTITRLGQINRMSYWQMNEKLVELYAEGPWMED